jgi:hypothetical protein
VISAAIISITIKKNPLNNRCIKFIANISFTGPGQFGRIETKHSASAINIFPYNKYHEMFLSRKHDLLKFNYEEFQDLFNAPIPWYYIRSYYYYQHNLVFHY